MKNFKQLLFTLSFLVLNVTAIKGHAVEREKKFCCAMAAITDERAHDIEKARRSYDFSPTTGTKTLSYDQLTKDGVVVPLKIEVKLKSELSIVGETEMKDISLAFVDPITKRQVLIDFGHKDDPVEGFDHIFIDWQIPVYAQLVILPPKEKGYLVHGQEIRMLSLFCGLQDKEDE